MTTLHSTDAFVNAKCSDKLPLQCNYCKCTFFLSKKKIQEALNPKYKRLGLYCSVSCSHKSSLKIKEYNCLNCQSVVLRRPSEVRGNIFCNKSCSATFNNKNRTNGYVRSKLEMFLETELTKIFPNINFIFNQKDAINSELDIFIPDLKLAFELNGIFHYEPIFGTNKLNQIQNNDNRKFQACLERGIELCIIDTSTQRYVTPKSSKLYLDIIVNIINNKI